MALSLMLLLVRWVGTSSCDVLLTVRIHNLAPLTDGQLNGVREETQRIWSPAGLCIVWEPWDASHRDATASVDVFVVGRGAISDARASVFHVASIAIDDSGVPEPQVFVRVHLAERVVLASRVGGRGPGPRPRVVRDELVARTVARTLAHELGHYLLRSRMHSADGLMRAQIPADEIVDRRSTGFVLGPSELATLRARWSRVPGRAQSSVGSARP
jgi:hypothetical protein